MLDALRRHAYGRVRANAVEAVARRARVGPGRRADALIEHKNDVHHRVRACAIRGMFHRGRMFGEAVGMLMEPAAAEALGAMLCDERPMHRVAGVWLADRMLGSGVGQPDLAGRIADMARSDPDEGARTRAARAAARLMAGVRNGWRERAADVGGGRLLESAP